MLGAHGLFLLLEEHLCLRGADLGRFQIEAALLFGPLEGGLPRDGQRALGGEPLAEGEPAIGEGLMRGYFACRVRAREVHQ